MFVPAALVTGLEYAPLRAIQGPARASAGHFPSGQTMRSTPDRIRHTICFEILAILMVVQLGNRLFGMPAMNMGAVGIASSVVAMIWNYLYNLGFDHALLRLTGRSQKKGFGVRALHAVLFEFSLTVLVLPVIMIILDVSLLDALVIDFSLTVFFLIYTFAFNFAYDRIFPIPE
jgi:uncharacterized membrane protein